MRSSKSFYKLSLTSVVISFLFLHCSDSVYVIDNDPQNIASRSCLTISQAWISQLKSLAANDYLVPASELEVSVIERTGGSTYTFHSHSGLTGRVATSATGFLLLVTHDGFEGGIVGYYDPTNLSFCTSPSSSFIIRGNVEDIVFTTLEILGVDADSF